MRGGIGIVCSLRIYFGNFMWSASEAALGTNLLVAQAGSHASNFIIDPKNKGVALWKREFDSRDDHMVIIGIIFSLDK